MNEKDNNKKVDSANPKIIWTDDKEIIEKKPPNEKIIFYNMQQDNDE